MAERDPNTEARQKAWDDAAAAIVQGADVLNAELVAQATELRQIRRALEQAGRALEQEREENTALWEVIRTSARQVNLTLTTAEEWSAAERRMDEIRRSKRASSSAASPEEKT